MVTGEHDGWIYLEPMCVKAHSDDVVVLHRGDRKIRFDGIWYDIAGYTEGNLQLKTTLTTRLVPIEHKELYTHNPS
jgi:hypothetical protein